MKEAVRDVALCMFCYITVLGMGMELVYTASHHSQMHILLIPALAVGGSDAGLEEGMEAEVGDGDEEEGGVEEEVGDGDEKSDVITLTQENFNEVISSEPLIMVEFYAPW